jgi:bifunctional non-homologous end joining protein LigD
MADDNLKPYRKKRDFTATPEPEGRAAGGGNRFVVHKHWATADHYDLRLEHDGVLLSWAVPKGPSLDPKAKRYAARTEDHPTDYIDFEGVIPKGQYGGGPMIVWDTGVWAPMGDVAKSLASGSFKFRLAGEKLNGGWMLARLNKGKVNPEGKEDWILFKEHDPAADPDTDILVARPESVKTGRLIEELVATPVPKPAARLRPSRLKGAVTAAFPAPIAPQLAGTMQTPPKDENWLHEIKLDGYRTMAYIEDGKARLLTRASLDWSHRYGDLPAAFSRLDVKSAVIDGEIVVLDDKGISHFSLLQEALSAGAGERLVFFAFDLLYLDGWDLRGVRLDERKALLAQLMAGDTTGALHYSDHIAGDPTALLANAIDLGLEGIISKKAAAPYQSKRSESWVKIKAPKAESFVIAGFIRSVATGGLASLALAEWVDGELVYRGKVGTGFDADDLSTLLVRLETMRSDDAPLAGAPRDVVWVTPVLTANIVYANRTREGLLRHAVFKGLREAELSSGPVAERKRLISDADLAGIWVTNPTRRLFGRSGPTKLDIAVYYAAVGDFMLPHILDRPVSLLRCPSSKPADCFFQRHAFTGMPPSIQTVETSNSEGHRQTYLTIVDAQAYLALAQFGVVEFHAWGTRASHIDKPDRIVFDLDPGEGIVWREVVEAAVHIRARLQALGLVPFVKTSGGSGVHIVIPVKPAQPWKTVHAITSKIATVIAATDPQTFTTIMGAPNRKGRIFIDYHRNARSATAVAPYSLRARHGMPASTPLSWSDLESIDHPQDLNYSSLPALLSDAGDPWAEIDDAARVLPDQKSIV